VRARVQRLGLALVKGTRHVGLDEIELDTHGPVGDRDFCLVDVAVRRVLRTVENPGLLGFTVRPLAGAERGDVVHAEPVSIVTTRALRRLCEAIPSGGYAVPPALAARFRATVTLVADEDPPPGTRLHRNPMYY